ncbi:MAG: TAXI family TRAP transporter solute-binding subunit, partial [Alphaproteobacteria bacterium]
MRRNEQREVAPSHCRELRTFTCKAASPGPKRRSAISKAKGVVLRALKQTVGLNANDMDVQSFGFAAAIQAFQDDKIDVIVLPTNVPSPSIMQFALTKKIRILDVNVDKMKINKAIGGTVNTIQPNAYGDKQVNETATRTHG